MYKKLYLSNKMKYLDIAKNIEMLIDLSDLETNYKLSIEDEDFKEHYEELQSNFLETYFELLPDSEKLLSLTEESVDEITIGKLHYRKLGEGNSNTVYVAQNDIGYVSRLCRANFIECVKDNVFINFLFTFWKQTTKAPNPFNPIVKFYYFYDSKNRLIPIFKTPRKYSTVQHYIEVIFKLDDEKETKRLLYELFDIIVQYITQLYKLCQFIHGDLKPDNLMCDIEGVELKRIYFIDLGCSQFVYKNVLYTTDIQLDEKYEKTYNKYKDVQFFMLYIYQVFFNNIELQNLLREFVKEYVDEKKIMRLEKYENRNIYMIEFGEFV